MHTFSILKHPVKLSLNTVVCGKKLRNQEQPSWIICISSYTEEGKPIPWCNTLYEPQTSLLWPKKKILWWGKGDLKAPIGEYSNAVQLEAATSIMLCTQSLLWTLGWWYDSPTKGSLFFCKSTVLLSAGRAEFHWMGGRHPPGCGCTVDEPW